MVEFSGERDSAPHARAETAVDLASNIAAVRGRMEAAAARAGRSVEEVRLLPVSKTVSEERIRLAVQAGCHELGENKVQEAKRKWQNLPDLDISWAIIGHLQTNKAKDVAAFATEFQALDSLRVAEALQRRLDAVDRTLDVHVQVNTSHEPQKYGIDPLEAIGFLRELRSCSRLRVRGFMTLALFTSEGERVRSCFALLRDLRDRVRAADPELVGKGELSMGMSGDFEVAVGYLADPEQAREIAEWFDSLTSSDRPVLVLDPTFGDDDVGFYTNPAVVPAIWEHLVPLVNILTPNSFELRHLVAMAQTGAAPEPGGATPSRDVLVRCARSLMGLRTHGVVLTGIRDTDEDTDLIGNVVITREREESFFLPEVASHSKGLGDTFAAALVANLIAGNGLGEAAERAAAHVRRVLLGQPII